VHYLDLPGLPHVSRVGLGTWQFGSPEWGYGRRYASEEAARIVARAVELGVTFFDTAELYGFGASERILGRALRGHHEVIVATKLWPLVPVAPVVVQRGRASARRLGVPRIDLYQVHQPHPVVPDTVIMQGMRRLVDAGLVGRVGVSNYGLARWRAAEAALGQPVLTNQVRFNLVQPDPERELPFAEGDRALIAYSPLAQGFLSGRYDESHRPRDAARHGNPLFVPDNLRAGAPLFAVLREVAAGHDATPAQVALAWLLRRPRVVVIPGASSVAQLEHNVAAADLDLTAEEDAALTAAAEAFHPVTGLAALPRLVRSWRRP
jgi:aryl-alcohol dehydrogenase-like predicted oxidoreductase